MPDLLPCPFCGGSDLIIADRCMFCVDCEAEGPYIEKWNNDDSPCDTEIVAKWNRRSDLASADLARVTAERDAARRHTPTNYVHKQMFAEVLAERDALRTVAKSAARVLPIAESDHAAVECEFGPFKDDEALRVIEQLAQALRAAGVEVAL